MGKRTLQRLSEPPRSYLCELPLDTETEDEMTVTSSESPTLRNPGEY